MTRVNAVCLLVYRQSLRLLPAPFRARYANEMESLVALRLQERAGAHPLRTIQRVASEIADVVRTAAAARTLPGGATSPADGPTRNARFVLPLRSAARRLARRPAFAVLAILTLGLGVGAATAMFTVLDAILIRPLPYVSSSELAMVWRTVPRASLARSTASYPDYLDWRQSASSFASLAATANANGTFTGDGEPERVAGLRVSGNFFATLGNAPHIGRVITPTDDTPAAERTIVLGDAIWRRRFGADSGVIGRQIRVGDSDYRVIGVMGRDFAYPTPRAQFWTPLRLDASRTERDANFLTVIGRLAKGATVERAAAEIASLSRRMAAANGGANGGLATWVESRKTFVVRDVARMVWLLTGAVALLVLIATANVGNLNVVRALARARELGVRRALGASRTRLIADQLAESTIVLGTVTVVGVAISFVCTRALLAYGPVLPRAAEIGVGARSIAFAVVIAACCAMVTGVLPYLSVIARRGIDAIGAGARATIGRGAHRWQHTFVGVQVALTLVLAVCAGLLTQSFMRLTAVPSGFDGAHVLTAKLSLPPGRYRGAPAVQQFYEQLLAKLAMMPGVEGTSGTWALPFADDYASSAFVPADKPVPDKPPALATLPVRGNFFHTLGIPVRHGREFTSQDRADTPPVVIVNEALARRFWGTTDVVGRQVRPADPSDGGVMEVVGVVADVKRRGLDVPAEPEIYLPHTQTPWAAGDLYITLRTSGDPLALLPSMRRTVAEQDPQLPLTSVGSLNQFVSASIIEPRFRTVLLGVFAVLATIIALVGVYGAISFVVAQRRQDMAVRSALGAAPRQLLAGVLRAGVGAAGVGVMAGLVVSRLVTPVMRTMLFGVRPVDVPTFSLVAIAVLITVAVACWIPARRAARTDPILALRDDGGS